MLFRQNRRRYIWVYAVGALAITFAVLIESARAEVLTIEEAVGLALQRDPALAGALERAHARDEQAIADGQLPDPMLALDLSNVPVDTFRFNQEPMTQVRVGMEQRFPPGSTRKYRRQKTQALADAERARHAEKARAIKLNVRTAWLDLYYALESQRSVSESERAIKQILDATRAFFETGRKHSQDVIRAELELSLIRDRRLDAVTRVEQARAELAKWVGDAASRPLPRHLPAFADPQAVEMLSEGLPAHPAMTALNATYTASQRDIDIARQQYKPGWRVGVNYGRREAEDQFGNKRPDFVSLMLRLDIPLFAWNRQDRRLEASKSNAASVMYERADLHRNLRAQVDHDYAAWRYLDDRVKGYEKDVLKQAEENVEAALSAYREDVADFADLMRAQLTQLDAELNSSRLRVERAKAHAQLLYFQGDS